MLQDDIVHRRNRWKPNKRVDLPKIEPAAQDESASDTIQVGARVRALRKERGLTIRTLAERCQLSTNTLGLIENNHTSPSVHTLHKLSRGLDVHISTFFECKVPDPNVVYQKAGEREESRFSNGTLADLGDGLAPLGAEPVLVTLESGPEPAADVSHVGREFIYCLEGRVNCTVGENLYQLSAGDSLLFDASIPHRWKNIGIKPSKLLVLFCAMDARDEPAGKHLDFS